MTSINFYILSHNKKLIPFVCQLTQTVLQKTDTGLMIFAPKTLLEPLDDQLWAFNDTTFIPHRIITVDDNDIDSKNTSDKTADTHFSSEVQPIEAILTDSSARLADFNGTIINLMTDPLTEILSHNTANKLLEIIAADELSVLHGRQKYRIYRDKFSQNNLQTFHIN